ncbi:hypothetical protein DO299_12510 [Salmonella enterica]|nr:hypothetical protein [Salmonella enterica subsp. enterica serovar Gaminara]EAA9480838.1 hypothetical protein [Salmonella enterica subsp. enterica]EAA9578502.1 hypothetical protein [Salmonella enterica subsp. enterica serovar Oranienburg]EAM5906117.1 hypothetical protein [Salmonella enterica]EAS6829308.1 hypothetical protein [Salmonella enterica subsp. enterica serovar Give]ECE0527356.1 hypothetical protein [Salmonella enterica subsp. salamae]MJC94239.1 hypothetical protein [Salmonella ente
MNERRLVTQRSIHFPFFAKAQNIKTTCTFFALVETLNKFTFQPPHLTIRFLYLLPLAERLLFNQLIAKCFNNHQKTHICIFFVLAEPLSKLTF